MIAIVQAADEILGVSIFEESSEGEAFARFEFQRRINEFLDTHEHDGERPVLTPHQRVWRSHCETFYIQLVKGAKINPR